MRFRAAVTTALTVMGLLAAVGFLTLMGWPSKDPAIPGADGVSYKYDHDYTRYVDGNQLGSNIGPDLVLKQNLRGDLRTYVDSYTGRYEPSDLNRDGYEANLTMPSSIAEQLFGNGGPFMEVEYTVSSDTKAKDDGVVVVTLRGHHRAVEYDRAEMGGMVLAAMARRITWKRSCTNPRSTEVMIVPEDMVAALRADGGERMEKWERLNPGAKVEISEGPSDSGDPATTRTVTISGGCDGRPFILALNEAVAEDFVRTTPDLWRVVCTYIDPERKEFMLGKDDMIMKELVDRTDCRVQLSNLILESYPAKQGLCITGPEDAANETLREIRRLIAEGESRMPPKALLMEDPYSEYFD